MAVNNESAAIKQYEPLIKSLAGKTCRQLPASHREDLIQEGRIAVMRALQSWDASKGASKNTFVTLCIKRAFWDYIEKEWNVISAVSLDETFNVGDGEQSLHDLLQQQPTQEDELYEQERNEMLKSAIGSLEAREQIIVFRRLGKGESCEDIANDVGLLRFRVSELVTESVEKLQKLVANGQS